MLRIFGKKPAYAVGSRVEVKTEGSREWISAIVSGDLGGGYFMVELLGGQTERIADKSIRVAQSNKIPTSSGPGSPSHTSEKRASLRQPITPAPPAEAPSQSPIASPKPAMQKTLSIRPSRRPSLLGKEDELQERVRDCNQSGQALLDIHGLGLGELKEAFLPLINLRQLLARKNAFTFIAPLLYFQYLERLDLSFNKLGVSEDSLNEIGKLQVLRCLDISSNGLRAFPADLQNLRSLEELRIRDNQISVIPDWLGMAMVVLRALDVSKNLIAEIPQSLEAAACLQSLCLDGNPCCDRIPAGSRTEHLVSRRKLMQSKELRRAAVRRSMAIQQQVIGVEKERAIAEYGLRP